MGSGVVDRSKQASMLDDQWWSGFSSDFSNYELGSPIGMFPSLSSPVDMIDKLSYLMMVSSGFGASSTVYAAVFRLTATMGEAEQQQRADQQQLRKLSIKVPPSALTGHGSDRVIECRSTVQRSPNSSFKQTPKCSSVSHSFMASPFTPANLSRYN